MPKVDILQFIKNPENLKGISLYDKIEKLSEMLGNPLETIGDGTTGFLHYKKGIRFSYTENKVDELAILFYRIESSSYSAKNNWGEKFKLSGKTQIHEVLYLLNTSDIKWKCDEGKHVGSFCIIIENGVYITFDLISGYLDRIGKHHISLVAADQLYKSANPSASNK